VLQAEGLTKTGDVADVVLAGAVGQATGPGATGGRLHGVFRTGRSGEYALSLRVGPGSRGFRVRVDDGEFMDVAPSRDAVGDVSPHVPLDGGKPLDWRHGRITVEGEAIRLEGQGAEASFFVPVDLAHTRIDARVSMPAADDPAHDDLLLLFDCLDEANGKFFGLADAGRRVVMGVIENRRPRVVKSIPRPEGSAGESLGIVLQPGVAVGRLDGKPVMFVNFDSGLGAARFGFLTHGSATVRECVVLHGAEEVHRLKASLGGVLHLRRGNHTFDVDLLPGSGPVDSVTIKEAAP
jgi:hypothetical protein